MKTERIVSPDIIDWLLEAENTSVRSLASRDLLNYPIDHSDLVAARKPAHAQGPIAEILAHMQEVGYWSEPSPGYLPKYWSTVWSIIVTLAQLGDSVHEDRRIETA